MKNILLFLSACIAIAAQAQTDTTRLIAKDTGRVDTSRLGVAEVRAEKRLLRQIPYGTVVQVGNSILTKGSSILEVLQRSPGVSIDYRNSGIALNGKSGVMVMIDGRLLRMPMDQVFAMLNGMSANDIEKIELLTTPPSRYDADGSAGMINIVLRRNKKPGTNATASATAGYGWREKATASLSLSHNRANSSFYGSYTFSHNRSYSDLQITSSQNMPWLGGNLFVDLHDTTHITHNDHDITAGFELRLRPKTRLSGSIHYSSSTAASHLYNHQTMTVLPDSVLSFNGYIQGRNRWKNGIGSLSLDREIRPGESLSIGGDYLYYHNDNPSSIQSVFLNPDGAPAGNNDSIYAPQQRTTATTGIHVEVFHLDYQKKLSEKIKMEAGLKGTYTQDTSASTIEGLVNGQWAARNETSALISMRENISAAYTSFNVQLSPKLSLDAGLRYEYSKTKMTSGGPENTIVDRRLGVFFPSVLLNLKKDENSSWQLSYTKRISRPSYNDLASFVGYSDPGAIYTGNPFLKPTITQNGKLQYNYKGYSFSLLFSHDDNPIARYQLTESPQKDLLEVSPQNMRTQDEITLQASLPWRVNNWWTITSGLVGNFNKSKLDYTLHPLRYHYFTGTVTLTQTFVLPSAFSIELSGNYYSHFYNGTVLVEGAGMVNMGIKKELKRSRSMIQLAASDLFRHQKYPVRYGTLTEEAYQISNHVLVNTESVIRPIVKLTWTKNLGGDALKKTGRTPEERDRVRME